jgi:single-strand DNA-binding protein
MISVNHSVIGGHLTKDPEVRIIRDVSVANFTIAVNRTVKDGNGGTRKDTTFIDCEAWNRSAELMAQYTKKGDAILVEGELKTQVWEDKKTGGKRSKVILRASRVNFLGNKRAENANAAQASTVHPDG